MLSLKVEFGLDKDAEIALNEVRNALDSVRADLPADMNEPVISKATTAGSPIATFAVESDLLDEESLSWFVDNDIAKRSIEAINKLVEKSNIN